MFVDVFNVVLAGGSLYHDPFLIATLSWYMKVVRSVLIVSSGTFETLGLDNHDVGIQHLDVSYFLEVILLM